MFFFEHIQVNRFNMTFQIEFSIEFFSTIITSILLVPVFVFILQRCRICVKATTDMRSLIENFDWGYSAVWKFSNFFPFWFYVKSTLAELRRLKAAPFQQALRLCSLIFWNFALENIKKYQIFKFQSCSNGQNGSFWASKWSKLISRKIWVAELFWNYLNVYSQLGVPGLYRPGSVNWEFPNVLAVPVFS